tara:strand:- start:278 stop:622 length:345 start_codon:yes stop_codon:yes gene_type:complete
MTNKYFCQGPECHTNPTTDRFLKSKGIIRGRYAYAPIDSQPGYRYSNSDKYFCSQACKLEWLHENMSAIEMGIPVPFIRERRFTEGYEKKKITYEHSNYSYNTIQKIGVDNTVE